jgi:hypothetical protein
VTLHSEAFALPWRRPTLLAAGVGGCGLLIAALDAVIGGADAFFRSYLFAYAFWLSLGLGSLGIMFIQFLTGGVWGLATRRIFEAGSATLPLLALLFLPILFGLPSLYAWARPEVVATEAVLQHKSIYLNVPFFVVRAFLYLAAWVALAYVLLRWSAAHDRDSAPWLLRRLQHLSIVGALVLGLTATFAAIDWLMSLDALWFSTMYPPMVAMSDLLLALAFGIFVVARLAPSTELGTMLTPRVYNDLGSLLLAFLMLWAYMAYFQYLLIWAGNLSDEIPWYLSRIDGGWLIVAIGIASFGFLVPFSFLLFRPLKRNPRSLARIALLLMVMRLLDVFWMVRPPFSPGGPSVSWIDLATLVGIGGLWLAVFLWRLASQPVLPRYDPRLDRALEAARAAA